MSAAKQTFPTPDAAWGEYRAALDHLPHVTWIADLDGRFTFLSQAWAQWTGRSTAGSLGDAWAASIHPEDAARLLAARTRARQDMQPYCAQCRIVGQEGGARLVRWQGVPVFDEGGARVGWTGTAIEFTDTAEPEHELRQTNRALEQSNSELQGAADDLAKRNQELSALARELATAGARLVAKDAALARSNRDFSDFAHAASHDMKAPLRHIDALVSGVLNREMLSDAARARLQRAVAAAGRLSALIGSLLKYAAVDSMALRTRPVDLRRVAHDVIDDLRGVIDEHHAVVEIDALPTVPGEESQLYQVLLNVIGNALKYHAPGVPPRVHVRAAAVQLEPGGAPGWEIAVQDHGIGFDEKDLAQVFAPFRRLVSRGEYEGSGIGLGTAVKVVQRHGGTITAHSAPGEGSTFLITLPATPRA